MFIVSVSSALPYSKLSAFAFLFEILDYLLLVPHVKLVHPPDGHEPQTLCANMSTCLEILWLFVSIFRSITFCVVTLPSFLSLCSVIM
jgi:hypothetical protein